MRRAFILVVFYAVAGALLTLVTYRLILGGPMTAPGADRTLDGLVAFLAITLNLLLAFGAAGVAAAMVRRAESGFVLALGVSAVVAGAVGVGMMLWFAGLNWMFPLTMIGAAMLCTVAAAGIGLLDKSERGTP